MLFSVHPLETNLGLYLHANYFNMIILIIIVTLSINVNIAVSIMRSYENVPIKTDIACTMKIKETPQNG